MTPHANSPANAPAAGRPRAVAALVVAAVLVVAAALVANAGEPALPFSDDFDACSIDGVLANGWSLVDPVGQATVEVVGAGGAGDTFVRATLPGGTLYDPWSATGNTALQLLQDVTPGQPLDLEAGFRSTPAGSFDLHGMLFVEDADTFVRVDVFRANATLRVFFGAEDAGARTVVVNTPIPEGHARFLRVAYDPASAAWSVFTSADGQEWLEHGTEVDTTLPLDVTRLGLHAGNPPAANDYVVEFDYFLDRTSPFPAGEDGAASPCGGCGDGIVDDGEDCDDGNRDDQDGCRNHCALPIATAGGPNPFSDDLNACDLADVLDNGWSVVDPWGAATVEPLDGGSGEAFLRMAVPSGFDYDPWNPTGNDALRLVQDVTGVGDFEIEVAFLSDPLDALDIQGLMVLEDDDTFVRVELFRDAAAATRLFVGTQDGATRGQRVNEVLDPGAGTTRFLRVAYAATVGEWRVWTSADGIDWTHHTATPIGFPMAATAMGLAVANGNAANAHAARFDYFRNLAEPFVPAEDGSTLPDCSICGNRTVNDGEFCDDGNTVDGDGCSASCELGCGSQTNVFTQPVRATDKRTFAWDLPVDTRFAVGNLGQVATYGTLASGVIPAATALDVGGTPPAGTGLYILFRVNCPRSTWCTGAGARCERDSTLP